MKSETRSLFNFFLSSFVNPMLRFWFPQRAKGPLRHGLPIWDTTWGNLAVYTLIIVGLIVSWFVTLKSCAMLALRSANTFCTPSAHLLHTFALLSAAMLVQGIARILEA
jgi:hypothetical protein